jgi:hypothetical protein
MSLPRIILIALLGILPLPGLGTTAQAGNVGGTDDRQYSRSSQAHEHGYGHDSGYRLRPGFALGYGVAGTNIGNPRYFEEPRSRTHGSTQPRLGPGGVYDRSSQQRHDSRGYGYPRGNYRHHDDRYQRGYNQGYRDGQRDGRGTQRHQLGR